MTDKTLLTEWLYRPDVKPAKELSKHDQEMIRLGWDAAKEVVGDWLLKNLIWELEPTEGVLCFRNIKNVRQSDAMIEALKQGKLSEG